MSTNMLTLKLQNYRRFVETDVISFPPGLTIISGPNGAGKSTLVEAFLYALYGPKKGVQGGQSGQRIADIHTDNIGGEVHVECELFIDDQPIRIIRSSNTAELRINDVVQIQNIASSGKAANGRIVALLGGLTRDQFEHTYVALQGDTAGLVEDKAEHRRRTIETILQLEVLTKAVELQNQLREKAKSSVVVLGDLISDELSLNDSTRKLIKQFQAARTTNSRVLNTQKFITNIEHMLSDQQSEQKNVEKKFAEIQVKVAALKQAHADHQAIIEQARQAYKQQDELRKSDSIYGERIARLDGSLNQIARDIQKYQEDLEKAEQCADASVEYNQLQTEKQLYEKRLGHIPLIERYHSAFVQAQVNLNNLDSQLAALATVDEELHQSQEQEVQAKLHWDTLRNNDPTMTDYEELRDRISQLKHNEQHNKNALEQLTNGMDEARCPTCDQRFTEHTPAHRIQHLTAWLEEELPRQHVQLRQQQQQIDGKKELWSQQQQKAEEQWNQCHRITGNTDRTVQKRYILLEQRKETYACFLETQQEWLELREDKPDPQEKITLQHRLNELAKHASELKELAEVYTQLPFFQKNLSDKQQEQEALRLTIQDLRTQQTAISYDPQAFLMAEEALERVRKQDGQIHNELHDAELVLRDTQVAVERAIEKMEKMRTHLDRFRANVQEYYREECLHEHLEDFKKHFFVANTEEVTQRTTQLLRHAITDQSILGIKFDKDEFQYIDAGNAVRPISRLSGGEKALIGLCLRIALAEQAQAITRTGRVKFLILDEVLSTLDEERCDAVQRIFEDVLQRGIFEHIIMITHLDTVKQSWRANGLVVQKMDGKVSKVISVSPGEIPMDLAEVIEV